MIYKQALVWILLWVWALPPGAAWGEAPATREYMVKAAMLFNFGKFVDWPQESFKNESSPFVIGILGADPFGALFETVKDKTIKGRKLVIRKLPRLENFEDCQILFFSKSEKGNLRPFLAATKKYNILTVSDIVDFAQQGGMIGLVEGENTIVFEVNLDTVQRSNLKVSSQLLKLAKIVGSGS